MPGALLSRPAPQVNFGVNPEALVMSLLLGEALEVRETPCWRRGK